MSLVDNIITGIHNLKTLEIRTIIGTWEEKWDQDKREKQITPNSGAKIILTQIDLLDGDITTAFGDDFLTAPLDKIREYHTAREKQGHEIIEANLKALQELMNLLMEAIKNHADAKQADKIEHDKIEQENTLGISFKEGGMGGVGG